MALPLPSGLTPPEIQFLCEMEIVTVIPRQRLESLVLLTGPTPSLRPPVRTPLPLYLALLLHRQKRAQILPPPWLAVAPLEHILQEEIQNPQTFSPSPQWAPTHPSYEPQLSPPFQISSTQEAQEDALPYHWFELSELLLTACYDTIQNVSGIRGLLRDIREVRASKLRAGMKGLEGGGVVSLRGVGAMEIYSERSFVVGVIGSLRILGASREVSRREGEENGGGSDRGSDTEMDYQDTQ